MPSWYTLSTSSGGGAIAVIDVGGDIAEGLARLGIKPVDIGAARLREWPGVDSIVVAVLSPTRAMLFPHGGIGIARRAAAALAAAGLQERPATLEGTPLTERFPEATSLIEARMLDALRAAASPLAIDLLLDQPRRWALAERDATLRLPAESSGRLNFLIHPPRVVALGPPNIGKSSLLNALAKRSVAIVADVPGTTRDHVGVALDLAGLVVQYVDTPGIGALAPTGQAEHDALDAHAQELAMEAAAGADLLLLCADPGTEFLTNHPPTPGPAMSLRVGLRADLGPSPAGTEVPVSVRDNSGLDLLVAAIRDRLVPPALLADPRAWAFWPMEGLS